MCIRDSSYIYLSGWMVAALRSQFGPLPDQSMHEKTSVSDLIEEIYTFLKQADARELRHMFVELDEARANGGDADSIIQRIDSYETHVVPIIADIDAGFGNEEATYLLAKRMIEAGACAIQIENQVSDAFRRVHYVLQRASSCHRSSFATSRRSRCGGAQRRIVSRKRGGRRRVFRRAKQRKGERGIFIR